MPHQMLPPVGCLKSIATSGVTLNVSDGIYVRFMDCMSNGKVTRIALSRYRLPIALLGLELLCSRMRTSSHPSIANVAMLNRQDAYLHVAFRSITLEGVKVISVLAASNTATS